MPRNKNIFDFTILGCSGGPISGKTCSFLLKPADVGYESIIENSDLNDCLLAIDAGTGLTSIVDILNFQNNDDKYLKTSFLVELYPQNFDTSDSLTESINNYTNCSNLSIVKPFSSLKDKNLDSSSLRIADKVLNSISGYLITHPHLDHVASLVINSPSFCRAKEVFGLNETIESIRNNLFNDSVWPDLVKMGIVSLNSINVDTKISNISKRYTITAFKVSHGIHSKLKTNYTSTSFLINDLKYDYNLLIFGDVESDLSSGKSFNSYIWSKISPLIINEKLSSMIIECSTIDKAPPLFGHMTPSNLFFELLNLRKFCIDSKYPEIRLKNLNFDDDFYKTINDQPLDSFNIIIIHVKETLDCVNPRSLILQQLNEYNLYHNMKINFTIALSGLSMLL